MLGYRNKATTFTFEVDGKIDVICSNATKYTDVIEIMGLPNTVCLKNAATYPIYDGRNDERTYINYVWAFRGTVPSGKDWVEYLAEKGVINKAEWEAILNADERQL